ncbi:MAG TPA: TIR domain-containing protein, partial [Gammaproteobacteria bacterium]|nr:TIR domain-containing protein [Gammaproteobacteria bacterium]
MKVFISWAKPKSKELASFLKSWLSSVIQATDCWISVDVAKGKRWSPEIANALDTTNFGIICVTRSNQTEPWLLFEAGAIAKKKDARTCTFLLDLQPHDLRPPLSDFQATTATR